MRVERMRLAACAIVLLVGSGCAQPPPEPTPARLLADGTWWYHVQVHGDEKDWQAWIRSVQGRPAARPAEAVVPFVREPVAEYHLGEYLAAFGVPFEETVVYRVAIAYSAEGMPGYWRSWIRTQDASDALAEHGFLRWEGERAWGLWSLECARGPWERGAPSPPRAEWGAGHEIAKEVQADRSARLERHYERVSLPMRGIGVSYAVLDIGADGSQERVCAYRTHTAEAFDLVDDGWVPALPG